MVLATVGLFRCQASCEAQFPFPSGRPNSHKGANRPIAPKVLPVLPQRPRQDLSEIRCASEVNPPKVRISRRALDSVAPSTDLSSFWFSVVGPFLVVGKHAGVPKPALRSKSLAWTTMTRVPRSLRPRSWRTEMTRMGLGTFDNLARSNATEMQRTSHMFRVRYGCYVRWKAHLSAFREEADGYFANLQANEQIGGVEYPMGKGH